MFPAASRTGENGWVTVDRERPAGLENRHRVHFPPAEDVGHCTAAGLWSLVEQDEREFLANIEIREGAVQLQVVRVDDPQSQAERTRVVNRFPKGVRRLKIEALAVSLPNAHVSAVVEARTARLSVIN